MSMRTLPLLFINLGGEMIYILDQRLRAQQISSEKSKKVLHDITGTMFNRRFMDDMFKPQDLYSKKALRTVFDRLAHASIMRLNSASMDKLYDLMTMAFKYQVSLALRPRDIFLVTLNHMDAIREFVKETEPVMVQVNHVYELLITNYGRLDNGEWMLIRQTLLNFFQDMHIRVSIFLKNRLQTPNGRFVLPKTGPVVYYAEEPGTIRTFNENGTAKQVKGFVSHTKFGPPLPEGAIGIVGDRVIKLGTNMYSTVNTLDSSKTKLTTVQMAEGDSSTPNPLAKAQLDLLSALIGSSSQNPKSKEFKLNLFKDEEEEEEAAIAYSADKETEARHINIDASKKMTNPELNRIMGELELENTASGDTDDLLDLMDSAN